MRLQRDWGCIETVLLVGRITRQCQGLGFIRESWIFWDIVPFNTPKTLGEKLDLYRIHLGLSYDNLAKMMDVDPAKLYWQMKKDEPSEYSKDRFENFVKEMWV